VDALRGEIETLQELANEGPAGLERDLAERGQQMDKLSKKITEAEEKVSIKANPKEVTSASPAPNPKTDPARKILEGHGERPKPRLNVLAALGSLKGAVASEQSRILDEVAALLASLDGGLASLSAKLRWHASAPFQINARSLNIARVVQSRAPLGTQTARHAGRLRHHVCEAGTKGSASSAYPTAPFRRS